MILFKKIGRMYFFLLWSYFILKNITRYKRSESKLVSNIIPKYNPIYENIQNISDKKILCNL